MKLSVRLGSGLLSILDQVCLSALNFAIAAFLIYSASKEEYGFYAQAFAIIMLLAGVQNALVLSPFVTVASPLSAGDRRRLWLVMGRLQVFAGAIIASVSALYLFALPPEVAAKQTPFAVCFAIALLGLLAREHLRVALLTSLKTYDAFKQTMVYAAGVIGAFAYLSQTGRLGAATALLSTGCAAICGFLLRAKLSDGHRKVSTGECNRDLVWRCWGHGKWALLITGVSWLATNSYTFTAAYFGGGVVASAELSAARFIGVPIATLMSAWAAQFRPRAASWAAAGHWGEFRYALVRSYIALFAVLLSYVAMIGLASLVLHEELLPPGYGGIKVYLLLWLAYFGVAAVSTMASASLQSASHYRVTFWAVGLGASVNFAVLLVTGDRLGAAAPLLGLIVGESVSCALMLALVMEKLRRKRLSEGFRDGTSESIGTEKRG